MAKKYVYSHMDKLVELLNEYAPDYCKDYPDDVIMDAIVISKRFGFIERLVKNDKIIYNKIHKIGYIGGHDDYIGYDICCEEPRPNDYECLIMELSIQDNPIEYLCSILKE